MTEVTFAMPDYEFDEDDSTIEDVGDLFLGRYSMRQLRMTIDNIVLVVTLATWIYGVTSWCVLKKFRNYRNYVFLNAILSNLFLNIVTNIDIFILYKYEYYIVSTCLHEYFSTAKTHWLLIISHMFYVDVVKVFNRNIRRRYLKSNIFGWGVPLITFTLDILQNGFNFFQAWSLEGVIILCISGLKQIVPVILNCFFYFIIVFSLCLSFKSNTHTAANIRRRLYMATMIFLLSDVLLLFDKFVYIIIYFNLKYFLDDHYFIELFNILNPLILDIVFIVLRSNRQIWYEFYINKLNQRRRDLDINMQRRIVREPAESRATVHDV